MSYSKGPKGTAERKHAELVKARGYCERCGMSSGPFECAHIFRRTWVGDPDGIRLCTNERNAWCLCHPCHDTVDNFQDEHQALVKKTIGRGPYEALKSAANTNHRAWRPADWVAESARLQALLKALEVAA